MLHFAFVLLSMDMTEITLPALQGTITLSNGVTTPLFHLGAYNMTAHQQGVAITWALKLGYRAIDCDQGGGRVAGQAIKSFLAGDEQSMVGREDIFYTEMISTNDNYEDTKERIRQSVRECGLGYIDLLLLQKCSHRRERERFHAWQAVEEAIDEGLIRMGGLANYTGTHIERFMLLNPRTKPVVNQIEVHPFNTRNKTRKTCATYGIIVEARAPLAGRYMMRDHKLLGISSHYRGFTPGQILLKWGLQHGMITMPRAVRRKHLVQVADVASLSLSDEHMKQLDSCNLNAFLGDMSGRRPCCIPFYCCQGYDGPYFDGRQDLP